MAGEHNYELNEMNLIYAEWMDRQFYIKMLPTPKTFIQSYYF